MNDKNDWSLELSGFKSPLGGVPRFVFNRVKNAWIYADNPSFFLNPKPLENLGFNRFLNLINVDGSKQLLVVPTGKITSTGYKPQCEIELPDVWKRGQKGEPSYFVYEVVDNELV